MALRKILILRRLAKRGLALRDAAAKRRLLRGRRALIQRKSEFLLSLAAHSAIFLTHQALSRDLFEDRPALVDPKPGEQEGRD